MSHQVNDYSDTPRTDAAEYFASDEPEEKLDLVDAGFARQLERELTAAQADLADKKELHDRLLREYAEVDDNVRKAALTAGITQDVIDGDSYSVPGIEELVDLIVQNLTAAQADSDKWRDEYNRMRQLIAKQNEDISQTCGKALGYPWFKDDQKNFPGSTEEHGVCVGEHVAETIAAELADAYKAAKEENAKLQERVKRLEAHGAWIPASTKPEGWERKVLCWVVWPACGWPAPPEAIIGWWKHGPGCFAVVDIECADHLVTHWMEITDPSEAKDTK